MQPICKGEMIEGGQDEDGKDVVEQHQIQAMWCVQRWRRSKAGNAVDIRVRGDAQEEKRARLKVVGRTLTKGKEEAQRRRRRRRRRRYSRSQHSAVAVVSGQSTG